MTKLFILILGVALFSCHGDDKSKMTTDEKKKIANKGVNIEYTDSEIGDTVLFFIHGWGINQTYWTNQVAYFSKNYRVITVDLPGFGKSGKNRSTWTVEDYTGDINAVLTQLGLKNVILIGHSMSGSIIVETALTHPFNIIGIIGIDNLKYAGFELTPEIEKEWAIYYAGARSNFKKTYSEGMANLFSPSTDSTIRKRVSEDILNSDTAIAVDCLENLDKYPFPGKLKSLNKPIYLLNSDYKPTDTMFFRNNKIKYHLLNIGPTGHYPMLEKPKEFNLLLKQAIDEIKANKAA